MKHSGRKILTIVIIVLILFSLSYTAAKLFGGTLTSTEDKIAVIEINGPITSGGFKIPLQRTGASSETLIKFLEQAEESKEIKAVLLDINSPGGTVVASREVAEKVKSLKKPVVAFINEIGTSGAYWIASAADKIVADPLSITGSIGVIASYLEFADLMEKYGVTYEQLISGKYKDLGSPFKKLTPEEHRLIQKKIDKIHEAFIREVAANRKLPVQDVEKIATGEYFLGEEAKELQLVDEVGTRDLALNITKQLIGVQKVTLVKFEETKSLLSLLTNLQSEALYSLGQGIGSEMSKNIEVQKTPQFYAV